MLSSARNEARSFLGAFFIKTLARSLEERPLSASDTLALLRESSACSDLVSRYQPNDT